MYNLTLFGKFWEPHITCHDILTCFIWFVLISIWEEQTLSALPSPKPSLFGLGAKTAWLDVQEKSMVCLQVSDVM